MTATGIGDTAARASLPVKTAAERRRQTDGTMAATARSPTAPDLRPRMYRPATILPLCQKPIRRPAGPRPHRVPGSPLHPCRDARRRKSSIRLRRREIVRWHQTTGARRQTTNTCGRTTMGRGGRTTTATPIRPRRQAGRIRPRQTGIPTGHLRVTPASQCAPLPLADPRDRPNLPVQLHRRHGPLRRHPLRRRRHQLRTTAIGRPRTKIGTNSCASRFHEAISFLRGTKAGRLADPRRRRHGRRGNGHRDVPVHPRILVGSAPLAPPTATLPA